MAKNRNWNDHNLPVWFDGKNINQALFCEEFLRTHKILFAEGAFFTSDGRVTGELPLRREIYEELRCCTVNNIPRKIGNIVEILKLAAQVEDFPPQADRIHLSNGTLILDGSIGKISENRFVRADLEHILLCVDDDMRMEALRQTNYVKTIVTAQGKMDLERKGKQSYRGWMSPVCWRSATGTCRHSLTTARAFTVGSSSSPQIKEKRWWRL